MSTKKSINKVALDTLIQNHEWCLYSDNLVNDTNDLLARRSNLYGRLLNADMLIYHAIYIEKDFRNARYLCYNLGRMLEAHFWALQTNLVSTNITIDYPRFAAFVLWSDDLTFIKRFQHLNFQSPNGFGQDKEPVDRFYHWHRRYTYSWPGYICYCLINEDWGEIEKMMGYAEKYSARRLDKPFNLPLQIELLKAIKAKNKDKIHDNLLELIQTTHTAFNPRRDYDGQVITAPAIGYLKAVWLLGMEIEINHHLVPMEMMPYQPLEKYEERYWFVLTEEEQKWQMDYSLSIPKDLYPI